MVEGELSSSRFDICRATCGIPNSAEECARMSRAKDLLSEFGSHKVRIILGTACIGYLSILLWGIQKDLPIAAEVDEYLFVEGAVRMG